MRSRKQRDRLILLARSHPDWVVGFDDEVWWSRLAQPRLSTWSPEEEPTRLQQHPADRAEKEPKALACYGLLRTDTKAMLRFVEERPLSSVTTQFLAWCAECLAAEGKRVYNYDRCELLDPLAKQAA